MTDTHPLPTRFDDYEVHGVREFKRGAKGYCEQVPDEKSHFWSLYGHIPGRGLDCIGDFKSRDAAEEAYARITGRPYREGNPPADSEGYIDVHQLLESRRRVHDCEVGFTWLLIETMAEDLFSKQPSTTKEQRP